MFSPAAAWKIIVVRPCVCFGYELVFHFEDLPARFGQEPVRPDHPLLGLKNVVATPHLAWLTRDTLERSINAALKSLERLRTGLPLESRVT